MLKLGGSQIIFSKDLQNEDSVIIKTTTEKDMPYPLRESRAYLLSSGEKIPEGFRLYVSIGASPVETNTEISQVILPNEYTYLANEDIIRLNPKKGSIRVLYRKSSPNNSFLTTERCNNYCLMCSQPPKEVDDSWIIDEIMEAIPLIPLDTKEIGLTGGEPTILGKDLIRILKALKSYLPNTAVHILSNGRNFKSLEFTKEYASVNHHDLMVGIPLYSDVSHIHDYVVQADGAFDETIRGILNLKKLKQKVEIRVVLHKQTISRLPQLAEFISRNLTFVDHVALMGLEMMGFTKANLDELWIDPYDYRSELSEAVNILSLSKVNVSIYNHQLCLLPEKLWPFSRQSISDWKNEYLSECNECSVKNQCGGFFSSTILKHSEYIHPIEEKLLSPIS